MNTKETETISKGQEKNGKIFEERFLVYEAEFSNLENGLSSLGEEIFLSIERKFHLAILAISPPSVLMLS
jgi:hypothetical protein